MMSSCSAKEHNTKLSVERERERRSRKDKKREWSTRRDHITSSQKAPRRSSGEPNSKSWPDRVHRPHKSEQAHVVGCPCQSQSWSWVAVQVKMRGNRRARMMVAKLLKWLDDSEIHRLDKGRERPSLSAPLRARTRPALIASSHPQQALRLPV